MSTFWVKCDPDGVEWVRQDVADGLSCAACMTVFLTSLAISVSGALYISEHGPHGGFGFAAFMATIFGFGGSLVFGLLALCLAADWREAYLRRGCMEAWTTASFPQVVVAWVCGNYLANGGEKRANGGEKHP